MSKVFLSVAVGLVVVVCSAFSALHTSGYVLATGSPHDGVTCTQCHTGSVGTVSVDVVANPAFGTGNTYLPGTTYTVNAVISGSFAKYGFDLEMLNSNGSIGVGDAGICGPAVSGNCQKVPFSTNPTNYTHTAPSGSGNSATFSFEWTAPASGPVYIYCAGLGSNGNNADNGDKVKTFSLTLSPTVGIEEDQEALHDLKIFPNPSVEHGSVSYKLDKAGEVTITVCDVGGRELQRSPDAFQEAGKHEVIFKEKLQRGVYLVRFSFNGKQKVQKLFVN